MSTDTAVRVFRDYTAHKQSSLASAILWRPTLSAANALARAKYSPLRGFYSNQFHRGIRDTLHGSRQTFAGSPAIASVLGPASGSLEYSAGQQLISRLAKQQGKSTSELLSELRSNPELVSNYVNTANSAISSGFAGQTAQPRSPFIRNIMSATKDVKSPEYYMTAPKGRLISSNLEPTGQGRRASVLSMLRGGVTGAVTQPLSPIAGAIQGAGAAAVETIPETVGAGLVGRKRWDVLGPLKSNMIMRGYGHTSATRPERLLTTVLSGLDPYARETTLLGRDLAAMATSPSLLARGAANKAVNEISHHTKPIKSIVNDALIDPARSFYANSVRPRLPGFVRRNSS